MNSTSLPLFLLLYLLWLHSPCENKRLVSCCLMVFLLSRRDVRTAAAMAMADFGVHPEGREILRREGAIRPLVLLLGEGIESPAAEQAAKALMTLAASDINKVAGHDCITQVTMWLAARLGAVTIDAYTTRGPSEEKPAHSCCGLLCLGTNVQLSYRR